MAYMLHFVEAAGDPDSSEYIVLVDEEDLDDDRIAALKADHGQAGFNLANMIALEPELETVPLLGQALWPQS